jgi:choline dehydrogenase-like flavoprotein
MRIPAPIEVAGPRLGDTAESGGGFLPGLARKALAAHAEVVVDPKRVPPDEVAGNVDRYMGSFRAQRTWVVKAALIGLWFYPLRFLKPPFPMMRPDARREFVEKRFVRDIFSRIRFARNLIQGMFRLSSQMVYLGYYGDQRTFDFTGYKPFTKRDRFDPKLKEVPKTLPRLKCLSPADLNGDTVEADAVVVGSGAAGAIIAYRLAEAGRRVLVLERGLHLHPSEFKEDEVTQISNLYADGALQISRDFRFQVLQGMCVGGSTVVNNAVCFNLPDDVRDHWNGPEHEAGLDEGRLEDSFTNVRCWLGVTKPPSDHLQKGADKFVEGMKALEPDAEIDVVEANIANCPGSGYCNIGCPYGTKLSMLDKVLPDGQERFGADNLQILPECRAERIETTNGRAEAVLATLGDGRTLRVEPRTIVVSAGAIASSWLLMQSKIAKGRAGRGLCFNMGSPITAEFDDVLESFDGVQISHYLQPGEGAGFVMESWFNPVVSQALNMPGWLDDHRKNMECFRHLTAAGVLVGTTKPGRLDRALFGGTDIHFTPARDDVQTLVDALKRLCRAYLKADARRVMPSTFQFLEFRNENEVDQLDEYVKKSHYLSIGSGHPQGGNALGGDPRKGVVDPSFRVHGFENLFVCDASVFPTATTVNPQLTVMALADYATPGIANAT